MRETALVESNTMGTGIGVRCESGDCGRMYWDGATGLRRLPFDMGEGDAMMDVAGSGIFACSMGIVTHAFATSLFCFRGELLLLV